MEFHFDFGSPNAYLSHRIIPEIEQRTGARFRYVPVLLGGVFKATNNRSPARRSPASATNWNTSVLRPSALCAATPSPGSTATRSFRSTLYASCAARWRRNWTASLAPYVAAVFHHMWEQPKKMDEVEVIRAALDQSGLDGAADPGALRGCGREAEVDRPTLTPPSRAHVRVTNVFHR